MTESSPAGPESGSRDRPTGKWTVLGWLAVAELLAMSLWFSATAVVPALTEQWGIDQGSAAWLTMSVQIGFVAGALLSALINLSDLWEPRRVFAAGALAGALANLAIPLLQPGFATAVVLRFLAGMCLALVYPVGMKIMASWTREDRGLGIGLLVGALTVGSAMPHLVRALGGVAAWEPVLYAASVMAALAALIAWWIGHSGPYGVPAPRFQWSQMGRAVTVRPLRLANGGYLGHMWELYAVWTWIPIFAAASLAAWAAEGHELPVESSVAASLIAFLAIAAGGPGSLVAGWAADRWGRTAITITSMGVSGACCLLSVLSFGRHPVILVVLALVWGFTIVADSAQFSSSVSELAEREYLGTQLTVQTALGFTLTLASIRGVPVVADHFGWRWAFAGLAIGPALGSLSMWLLRQTPESRQLAGGRK